jgi:hypothetical protein
MCVKYRANVDKAMEMKILKPLQGAFVFLEITKYTAQKM